MPFDAGLLDGVLGLVGPVRDGDAHAHVDALDALALAGDVLAALGVDPTRTLVLEDSLSGVRAGTSGGFITVMVPDLVAPDDYARTHAACICKDLLEVRDLLAAGKLG